MGTKNTSSSGSVLEEPEIQKLQIQAKIFREYSFEKHIKCTKSTTNFFEQQSYCINKLFCTTTLEKSSEPQAPFLNVKMTFEHSSSSLGHHCEMTIEQRSSTLVLHQMTSVHNRSELGIHDHSNEPSSSKLVPKVIPLAVKTATSRQELELLFHLHIAMLRTTDIRTAEMAKTIKDNDKGSKVQDRKAEGTSLQQINEDKDQEHSA
ncbi:hypothetical protein Tco_0169793 [Tanacetum coccineum]